MGKTLENFYKNTLFVFVIYKLKYENSDSFISLINQNCNYNADIFIYDNSPEADISDFNDDKINIIYKNDKFNSGLSKAYNEAAKYALSINKKQIVIFDQDTKFGKDLTLHFAVAQKEHPGIKIFAPILYYRGNRIFSPAKYFSKKGFSVGYKLNSGIYSLKKLKPVNSCMLIDLKAFFECGGYNEYIKLDLSDYDFIERFRRYNNFFYLIEYSAIQDFSDEKNDPEIMKFRYKLFCNGAKECTFSLCDSFITSIIVFLRGLHRYEKTGDKAFFYIFYHQFLKYKKHVRK